MVLMEKVILPRPKGEPMYIARLLRLPLPYRLVLWQTSSQLRTVCPANKFGIENCYPGERGAAASGKMQQTCAVERMSCSGRVPPVLHLGYQSLSPDLSCQSSWLYTAYDWIILIVQY
jgi:hypothetical protein